MKSPDERGLTAQRLVDVRKAAGFTNQKAAAAHVREVTGVRGLTDSQWASYESGDSRRPFQNKHRAAIESVFGPLRDEQQEAPTSAGDIGALLAEMREANRINQQLVGVVAALVAGLSKERALTAEMFLAEGEGMTASVQAGLSLIREDIQSALASVSSLVLETSGAPRPGQS